MLIGKDFEKISFELFDLKLLEPNAFIGDTIITILAFYLGFKTYSFYKKTRLLTFRYWTGFFFVFGTGFFLGGFGHLFFEYTGIPGKVPSWVSGILCPMFIGLAMTSLLKKELFDKLAIFFKIKAFLFLVALAMILLFMDVEAKPELGLVLPTVANLIGLIYALGFLGYRFSKRIYSDFWYLWLSVIVMFPSVIFQAFKINLHQWFDRNDMSHALLIVNIILYYLAVRGYFRFQTSSDKGREDILNRGAVS